MGRDLLVPHAEKVSPRRICNTLRLSTRALTRPAVYVSAQYCAAVTGEYYRSPAVYLAVGMALERRLVFPEVVWSLFPV